MSFTDCDSTMTHTRKTLSRNKRLVVVIFYWFSLVNEDPAIAGFSLYSEFRELLNLQ